MTKPSDILIKARALIEHESHWTQGAFARDMNNKSVSVHSQDACKFCSIGAMSKAASDLKVKDSAAATDAFNILCEAFGIEVMYINDTRHHSTVINCWDLAIKKALKREEETLDR